MKLMELYERSMKEVHSPQKQSIHVLIKYGCWEGHDQSYAHDQSCTLWTTQRSSANVWTIELVFTSVRYREHIKHTRKIYEKMTPQKVILPSDVFAWLSNIIANGSVRQTQKHFTNFMCSSFVFWLAEETKCSSASQASCFWRLHVTQLGTSRTVHIRTCVASSFHISPSSKYLR